MTLCFPNHLTFSLIELILVLYEPAFHFDGIVNICGSGAKLSKQHAILYTISTILLILFDFWCSLYSGVSTYLQWFHTSARVLFPRILFHQMSPLNVDSHTFRVCLTFLWWKTHSYQGFRQMLQVLFYFWTMNCLYLKRMCAAPGGRTREYIPLYLFKFFIFNVNAIDTVIYVLL